MKKLMLALLLFLPISAHAASLDMCQGSCDVNNIHTTWAADTKSNTIKFTATVEKGSFYLCHWFMKFVQNGQQFDLPTIHWNASEIPRIECTGFDCCDTVMETVSVSGTIYPPAWFDVSKEFTVYYSKISVCVGCPEPSNPCAAEAALGADHPGLAKLRTLRDSMQQSAAGSLLVKAYFHASPAISAQIESSPALRSATAALLEHCINVLP